MGISPSSLEASRRRGDPGLAPQHGLVLFLGWCPFLEASTRRSTRLQAEEPKLESEPGPRHPRDSASHPRLPPEARVWPVRTRELVVAC